MDSYPMKEGVPIRQDIKSCTGCGAKIIWVKTAANDKWIPLDAKPERRMVINAEKKAESVTAWMPHHTTCSKAKDFKR